jgi:DNA-binding CsgD family transcriptional regulator
VSVSEEKILALFKTYNMARSHGWQRSFAQLAQKANMSVMTAYKILKNSNLPSLIRSLPSTPRGRYSTDLFLRLGALGLTGGDIATFLNIQPSLVNQQLRRENCSIPNHQPISRHGQYRGVQALTYPLASNVYEKQDLGLRAEQIAERLNKSIEPVEYAIAHRNKIEPVIVQALQLIYPGQNITKPYK